MLKRLTCLFTCSYVALVASLTYVVVDSLLTVFEKDSIP